MADLENVAFGKEASAVCHPVMLIGNEHGDFQGCPFNCAVEDGPPLFDNALPPVMGV